jgi:CDP-glucose 4,6-dehydratase
MIRELEKYYNGKTVFITGHTGFKGSWLSLWLIKLGAKVVGYSLDPLDKNGIFSLTELSKKMTDIRGDIRDYNFLNESIRKSYPDVIFHLAAQPLVLDSYSNPFDTYDINVMGTMNLLRCVRDINKQVEVVVITTDKVYRNDNNNQRFVESDPLGGYDPYSSSKACADILVESWRYSFFSRDNFIKHKKSFSSVRAGNVIGGGDVAPNRLIPDIIRAISKNTDLSIRYPNSTRPWQHVLEPIFGYLLLAFKMNIDPIKYSGAWNFGPNTEEVFTVSDIVDKFKRAFSNLRVLYQDSSLKESNTLAIDSSKAATLLNWNPVLDIDNTIKLIIEWETARINGNKMEQIVYSQIDYFSELILKRS